MPTVQNPFLYIVPRAEEDIINFRQFIENLDSTIKCMQTGGIIFISGPYGSGKTLILNHLKKKFSKENIEVISMDFNLNTMFKIKSLPLGKKMIVMIDRFDLADTLNNETLKKLLDSINEISSHNVIFIIAIIPELLTRIFALDEKIKNRAKILDVPLLNEKEIRELIVSRLNEIRKEKSDSIEPFTEEDI
ncbi:MAG: P-loop NTPase fold protein, partial [Candidatus Nanoarchaeia archaeon]|nr:P-loop NTPase fold protein [Candidatus Jingweiarchaeum tengchongense]